MPRISFLVELFSSTVARFELFRMNWVVFAWLMVSAGVNLVGSGCQLSSTDSVACGGSAEIGCSMHFGCQGAAPFLTVDAIIRVRDSEEEGGAIRWLSHHSLEREREKKKKENESTFASLTFPRGSCTRGDEEGEASANPNPRLSCRSLDEEGKGSHRREQKKSRK